MTPHTIPQAVLFPDLFDKPLVATFNQEHASSDGGAVLLKAAERVYGLVKAFARCLADKRAPGKIRHTLADLIGQRVFGIACGHPDGNDADHLADDPIHKLLLGRDPVSGAPLASQPTISRFENGARRTVLYRMGRELAACVIERHRRRLHGRARRITIDLDPTDDLTHGAQQLTFFNGHYGGWCYLPMLGFLSFDREAEQYLCAAVLRLGKAVAADGTLGLLSRLLPLLRAAFPRARFLVRLDGGFATPEIFDFLDAEPRLDYVVAMAKNAVLQRHAESAMQVARAQSEVGGETAHVYTDTRYAARTWDHERRVCKAEVRQQTRSRSVRRGHRQPPGCTYPTFNQTGLRPEPPASACGLDPFAPRRSRRGALCARCGVCTVLRRRLLGDAEELHFEEERGIARNSRRTAGGTVSEFGRGDDDSAAADPHAKEAAVPALDDPAGAENELNGPGIELRPLVLGRVPVVQPAGVSDPEHVAIHRLRAGADH